MSEYGPITPQVPHQEYSNFSTKEYLTGHAGKITHDLNKIARLYNGRRLRVYTHGNDEKCTYCVDNITGSIVLSNCPICKGTGSVSRELLGEYWGFVDFGPWVKAPTEFGNTINQGGQRDTFTLICQTRLQDQYLIVPVETKEVFKVINTEPLLVAMQGTIVTQVVHCSKMAYGSPEYSVVDW